MTERPETAGFQKPLHGPMKSVGLARISYVVLKNRQAAECSCGWVGWHTRSKVLEDRIDAHVERRHAGRAIRL